MKAKKNIYAAGTSVSVNSSILEIESLLNKYGADQFVIAKSNGIPQLLFRMKGKFYFKIAAPVKPINSKEFCVDQYGRKKSEADINKAYEQHLKEVWRAMVLIVKSKLVAVDHCISSFEEAFLQELMMPDGKSTAKDHLLPALESYYETGKTPALLPEFT